MEIELADGDARTDVCIVIPPFDQIKLPLLGPAILIAACRQRRLKVRGIFGNIMLGFDSPGARHTASIIYNVFGERLYTAGRNGAPDSYEQPFHSLDFTYFWYPTDTMTLKIKAQNLLDDSTTIERAGVRVFEEEPGQTFSISFSWAP